jgi:hypothetical protein
MLTLNNTCNYKEIIDNHFLICEINDCIIPYKAIYVSNTKISELSDSQNLK